MICSRRVFCGNEIHTFPCRGSGVLEFVRDAFVRAPDFSFITGLWDYPESRKKTQEKSRGMP